MAWIAVATIGGSIVGGMIQSDAIGSAADQQSAAARDANALQKYMYDQTRTDNARGVERYGIYDNSASGTHGPDSSFTGMMHVERYNNTCYFDIPSTAGDTVNIQCFFDWRGGTGVLYDNAIPDITSGAWGAKPEVKCQMQALQRAGGPFGPWGHYAGSLTGNFSALVGGSGLTAFPLPRQCGYGHPTSGNVSTDVLGTATTKSTFYVTGTTRNMASAAPLSGDTAILTGVDTNSVPTYMGNYDPIYSSGNTGTGDYSNISGENYASPGAEYADGAVYFTFGAATGTAVGWVNASKPGYTKYTYPHPLRTS
jgi:hypothetical protein